MPDKPKSKIVDIKSKVQQRIEEEREVHQNEDDFSAHPWPSLADAARSSLAGRFVELATRKSEADPAAVLLTFLARFGIECGPGVWLQVGDSRQRPRVNAVVVGASSKARKGTSAAPVKKVFDVIENHANTTPGPLSSGEGIIYRVRDKVKKWITDKDGSNGRWVAIDPGVEDKRLFVLDEEFASALKAMQREGNNLSTILRCAFDSGNMETITKVANKATGAHVGFVSHCTIQELHSLLNQTENFNGFSNRILWACARRQCVVPFPEPMPEYELNKTRREISEAIVAAEKRGRIDLSPASRDKWATIYPELSQDKPGLIGCITNRAEVLVLRLSLIYALLDRANSIEPCHLESALGVWSYCEQSAQFIFADRDMNPHTNKLFEALREVKRLTLTQVRDVFNRHATREQIQTAISDLVAANKARIETEQTQGRRRVTYVCYSDICDIAT